MNASRESNAGLRLFALLAPFLWFVAGCQSTRPEPVPPGETQEMAVTSRTEFYQYGPAQGMGPDHTLNPGDRVQLVRRQFGFSRVQLEGGLTGYIATEHLKPAPPRTEEGPEAERRQPAAAGARRQTRPAASRASVRPPESFEEPELPTGAADRRPVPGFRY